MTSEQTPQRKNSQDEEHENVSLGANPHFDKGSEDASEPPLKSTTEQAEMRQELAELRMNNIELEATIQRKILSFKKSEKEQEELSLKLNDRNQRISQLSLRNTESWDIQGQHYPTPSGGRMSRGR